MELTHRHLTVHVTDSRAEMHYAMPSVTSFGYQPDPVLPEQPIFIILAIRTETIGPVSIGFAIDDNSPFFFAEGIMRSKSIYRRRTFETEGNHQCHLHFLIVHNNAIAENIKLIITLSGIDGTGPPFHATLNIRQVCNQ
ncbi:MAG: hypothetical protein ABIQ57_07880 [Candidatus Kapaibacterium sp.]